MVGYHAHHARVRAQEGLIHSQPRGGSTVRKYGVRLKSSSYVLLLLECLKFAMHTAARRNAAFVDLEE